MRWEVEGVEEEVEEVWGGRAVGMTVREVAKEMGSEEEEGRTVEMSSSEGSS